ncbi:hypothetical protein ES332_D11G083600v1 [Gossypium tomentosum]|uniref:Uncharacterized protein n=1 Tax=Gossypium tomentosum TaxID=34277 RepID=A0A5D2IKN8_GOSTO|nr:hypothetical protein ES332_D11G083600v1 [Gossypium tomentosum]
MHEQATRPPNKKKQSFKRRLAIQYWCGKAINQVNGTLTLKLFDRFTKLSLNQFLKLTKVIHSLRLLANQIYPSEPSTEARPQRLETTKENESVYSLTETENESVPSPIKREDLPEYGVASFNAEESRQTWLLAPELGYQEVPTGPGTELGPNEDGPLVCGLNSWHSWISTPILTVLMHGLTIKSNPWSSVLLWRPTTRTTLIRIFHRSAERRHFITAVTIEAALGDPLPKSLATTTRDWPTTTRRTFNCRRCRVFHQI